MGRRQDCARTGLALAGLALAGLAAAGDVAPRPVPDRAATPWNTSTAPAPAQPPAEDSTLSLRIYDESLGRAPLPYRPVPGRRDDPAWAVDVSAVMTRCADGSLLITALVIGGQLTPLDARCPEARKPDRPAAGAGAPQCDGNTWNCTAKPAR